MITTYTQLYLVFGGIIDFYSQKIFMVWLFEYSLSSTIGRNIHGKEIKLFYLIEQESVKMNHGFYYHSNETLIEGLSSPFNT